MADGRMLTDDPEQVALFSKHRDLLVGFAYRMLGSVHDAEDVVQDVWLRWTRVDPATVEDARSFLLKATSRLAIDRLRHAQVQRAAYDGPWLPEPMPTTPDATRGIEQAESVSMAMMVVLETLSPLERAVFVMREAFGFGYSEIADTLGRSESAIRQMAHRARRHVTDRRPRFAADKATLRAVTARFMYACMGGDMSTLLEILSPSVEFVADTGGIARAPRRVILGRDKAARFLTSTWRRTRLRDPDVRLADLNGGTGIVVTSDGVPAYALALELADGVVQHIYMVANPGKLAHLGQEKTGAPLPCAPGSLLPGEDQRGR